MQLTFEHHGTKYTCLTEEAKSIAIQLDFDGPQPNHFGTEKAHKSPLKLGGFVGDTENGGSCNVDVVSMVPHCNGTHTETVGHIVNEDIWLGHAAQNVISVAVLVSVTPVDSSQSGESYRPPLEDADRVITRVALQKVLDAAKVTTFLPEALIIRTLPNQVEKKSMAYNEASQPPFLTVEAMNLVNELGMRHLLVDFPSVDRMYDDGLLTNHHLFWNVKEKTHALSDATWQDKTISEMVFVPDDIADGLFALNLQVPPFGTDAGPSRPILMPLAQKK